jgi:hypothetical protein
VWNAANRLIEACQKYPTDHSGDTRTLLTYDYAGRLVRKRVYPWVVHPNPDPPDESHWAMTAAVDRKFVWDGAGAGDPSLAPPVMIGGGRELAGGFWPVPGDMNCDGAVDFDDINPFVACLVNGGCP